MATQKVTLDPEVALVTRAEALRFLRLEPNEVEPNLIESLINAASTFTNNYCQRHLKVKAYTEVNPRGNPLGMQELIVPEYPIIQVTQIAIRDLDNTGTEVLDPSTYLIQDPNVGIIRLLSSIDVSMGASFRRATVWPDGWRILIDLEAGFGPNTLDPNALVPADLKEAVLIIIGSMYTKVDQKDHRIASRAIEGITEAFQEDDVPTEAKARLDAGYKRAGFYGAVR